MQHTHHPALRKVRPMPCVNLSRASHRARLTHRLQNPFGAAILRNVPLRSAAPITPADIDLLHVFCYRTTLPHISRRVSITTTLGTTYTVICTHAPAPRPLVGGLLTPKAFRALLYSSFQFAIA